MWGRSGRGRGGFGICQKSNLKNRDRLFITVHPWCLTNDWNVLYFILLSLTCLIKPLWLSVSLYLEISKGDEISTEWLIKEPSIVCIKKWNESLVETPKERRSVLWRPCTLALVYKEMWDMGFPGGTSGKEPTCQRRRCKRHGFDPWVGKISWRRAWPPTPVFLPGESHGQRSLVGYNSEGHKESDVPEMT